MRGRYVSLDPKRTFVGVLHLQLGDEHEFVRAYGEAPAMALV